jgi:putative methionine-R-sulfoxide reductase with GAF domain
LQRLAKPAFLSRFPFHGLHTIAEHCAPGDVQVMYSLLKRGSVRVGRASKALLPVRPIATMNTMDEARLMEEVSRKLEDDGDRQRKVAGIAGAIRSAGGYRWVGLYEVTEDEIINLAFDGPGAPTHPRFPVTQGLSSSAVASGKTVVVGDVSKDPRYLTAFGSTRSEIIVPVLDRTGRKVVGTIDVESDRVDAFSEEDRAALERSAAVVAGIFV